MTKKKDDAPSPIIKDAAVIHLVEILDLDPDALKERLDADDKVALSQGQVAGLLEVERSGKNRADIVQVLMDWLGISSPYEVTDAGRTTPTRSIGTFWNARDPAWR